MQWELGKAVGPGDSHTQDSWEERVTGGHRFWLQVLGPELGKEVGPSGGGRELPSLQTVVLGGPLAHKAPFKSPCTLHKKEKATSPSSVSICDSISMFLTG